MFSKFRNFLYKYPKTSSCFVTTSFFSLHECWAINTKNIDKLLIKNEFVLGFYVKHSAVRVCDIPQKYITRGLCAQVVNNRVEDYIHIPDCYKTYDMAICYVLCLACRFNEIPNHHRSQHIVELFVNEHPTSIDEIPYELHTQSLSNTAFNKNINSFDKIQSQFITAEMCNEIPLGSHNMSFIPLNLVDRYLSRFDKSVFCLENIDKTYEHYIEHYCYEECRYYNSSIKCNNNLFSGLTMGVDTFYKYFPKMNLYRIKDANGIFTDRYTLHPNAKYSSLVPTRIPNGSIISFYPHNKYITEHNEILTIQTIDIYPSVNPNTFIS